MKRQWLPAGASLPSRSPLPASRPPPAAPGQRHQAFGGSRWRCGRDGENCGGEEVRICAVGPGEGGGVCVNVLRAGLCKGAEGEGGAFGGGDHSCAPLQREGGREGWMLGCTAALCPFPAGMCVRCVCARVPPAFPRREAEGDGAPTTEGSRHQPSRLRQKIAVVPALPAGLAAPPPAPRSARGVPARHRPGPGAEEEEGTRAWARQGYGGTVPGRGREMEPWGRGGIGPPLWARPPRPGSGACGDQQRLLHSVFSPRPP